MDELDSIIRQINEEFGEGTIMPASEMPRPQSSLDREAFDDFNTRNPMAAGGMLAQPSADGSRQEYATSTVKTKKFKYPITNQFGTFYSDKAPPKVKSKYDNLTPEMKDFYKKITGKTWNKKDWDSGNYQRQNLSRKGKQSKVVKESKMSPFYKKIGFFKQFENNVRVKGERLKLNKKGYITFEQLNNLLGRKDTESAIDDLKRVLVGDRPSPWLEKKEGVAKWKKSKNLVIKRGDSMGTNYIKYPDKKTLESMKQYYKNQEFIDIAKRDVLRKPSIEGMKVFYEDKDLMNAIRKWSGNPNDKEALKIINSVFGAEELAGPNAIKNLGRALIGEIKVEGIKQDKVLGKKILEGVTRTANGQAGRSAWDQAAYMYAKDRMNMLFERGIGDKSFQQFFDEIDGLLRETLGKNRAKFHIDEVFSLRTGLTNNNQVYSVFSQILDKNLNSKIKQNYDATFSKNLINVRKELAKNNPDFNEVKRLTDLQNIKYKEYSSKYPNAKFSTFGEFDIEKNRFKSPEEVFGTERFNQLPSDIQKKIKQDYRKNRISIDVGGAQTQKELLTSLEKNIKPGSTLNKKQFETLLASFSANPKCRVTFGKGQKEGGRIGYATGPANLVDCADSGRKRLEKVIKTGVKLGPQEGALATQILKAGRSLGSAFALRNILGPAAVGFTVLAEAGLVGYDMLSEGKTFREAVGDSLFNYALGEKTKIDPQEELFKRFEGLGYDNQQMFRIKKALDTANTINTGMNLGMDIVNQKAEVDKLGKQYEQDSQQIMMPEDEQMQSDQLFRAQQKEKDLMNQMAAYNEDLSAVAVGDTEAKEDMLNKYIQSGDYARGLELFSNADRLAEIERLENINNPFAGRLRQEEISNRLRELKLNDPRIREYMGPFPTTYGFNDGGRAGFTGGGYGKDAAKYIKEIETDHHKGYQYYKKHGGKKSFKQYMRESMSKYFAGGGIAGLSGGDPEGAMTRSMNPDSQGLSYLFNRGKKT